MIPKVIHRVWVGDTPPPDYAAQLFERTQALHPHWQFEFWTEQRLHEVPMSPGLQALYAAAIHARTRSELLRYAVLLNHGGIYIDLDVEAVRPFDGLLELGFPIFTAGPAGGFCAFMGCVPGNVTLRNVLDHAAKREDLRNKARAPRDLGVGTNEIYKLLLGEWGIAMLPPISLCCPPTWPEREHAYAIHYKRYQLKKMGLI